MRGANRALLCGGDAHKEVFGFFEVSAFVAEVSEAFGEGDEAGVVF